MGPIFLGFKTILALLILTKSADYPVKAYNNFMLSDEIVNKKTAIPIAPYIS
jgi:hypothetical protein